jgi:DNA-binding GntR family transcriptional regulator
MTMTTAKNPRPHLSKLAPLAARTLVDQVVDAIVEATARGVFLPGDRIVEAEVARALSVSRIPVREALRLLESQSVVVSERYRGMRLMSVDIDGLEKILRVRLVLEQLAGAEAMPRIAKDPSVLAPLEAIFSDMNAAAEAGDDLQVATLDTTFHRCLCEMSDNEALVRSWEPLSRQLTIIFGLATRRKTLTSIAAEHADVIAALRAGDRATFDRLMEVHILEYTRAVDYEALVEQLRRIARERKAV